MITSKYFTDPMPDLTKNLTAEDLIRPEVIALIVDFSQLVPPEADLMTAGTHLMRYPGAEFVDPVLKKLAAILGLLCRELADGKNKKNIRAYLKCRVADAFFLTTCSGRDLIPIVVGAVRRDYFTASHWESKSDKL